MTNCNPTITIEPNGDAIIHGEGQSIRIPRSDRNRLALALKLKPEITDAQRAEGKRIREIRGSMSQQQFAQELGVSVRSINDWEHGRSSPRGLQRAALERMERTKKGPQS